MSNEKPAYASSDQAVIDVLGQVEAAMYQHPDFEDGLRPFTYADAGRLHMILQDVLRSVLPSPWKRE
jgi:hypothetical protein